MAEFRMPKMGDGMEEGTVLRWLKREGEQIKADEPVVEIETDKANVEAAADESGPLSKIVVNEGETVPVGAVIAIIGDASPATLSQEPVSESHAIDALPTAAPSVSASSPTTERVKATPLARRMAAQAGVDLAMVRGTGPNDRIVKRDVEIAAEKLNSSDAALPVTAPASAKPATASPFLQGVDVDISRMRKAIARRTVLSKQTVPHFYIVMPIEMDKAMDLLASINEQDPAGKITVNDLAVKACAVALTRFPEVNVSYTPDEKIRRYEQINIGIAVGTDGGLTIPVITDCGSKTLRRISADAKELIGKARGGTLTPQEMSGGTFTVSNLGMFGVEEFMAIINPPESCILACGAAAVEAAIDANGSVTAKRRMRVTLSCDHRTVDGLLGARFLQEIKKLLEAPLNLLA